MPPENTEIDSQNQQAPGGPDNDAADNDSNAKGEEMFSADYVAKLRKEAANHRALAKERAEKIAALELENNELKLEGLRTTVAIEHGIDLDTAKLLLTATDEAGLTAQAQALGAARKSTAQTVSLKPAGAAGSVEQENAASALRALMAHK